MRRILIGTLTAFAILFWSGTQIVFAQDSETSPSTVYKPPLAPSAEEHAALVAEILAADPKMPTSLVSQFADARLQIGHESSCALLEWLISPESAAPPQAREVASRHLSICRLPINDITQQRAEEMLGENALAAELSGGILTVVARSPENYVQLCCSVSGLMERLGESGIWAFRNRLPEEEYAMLLLHDMASRSTQPLVVRGPKAPPAPQRIVGQLQGKVVRRQIYSDALGETRNLLIYLPPGWSPEREWPVVYLADGAAYMFSLIVEKMILDNEIPPLLLVSAEAAPFGIDGPPPSLPIDLRSAEYINRYPGGLGGDRFDRHMAFFSGELSRYAQVEFGASTHRSDVSVAGFSNGGVLALWAGLLHPEIYGASIAMSPGIAALQPDDLTRNLRSRFYLSGGLYEPSFRREARRTEETLSAAGFEVSGRYLAAGHASDQWDIIFADAVRDIYGNDRSPVN